MRTSTSSSEMHTAKKISKEEIQRPKSLYLTMTEGRPISNMALLKQNIGFLRDVGKPRSKFITKKGFQEKLES